MIIFVILNLSICPKHTCKIFSISYYISLYKNTVIHLGARLYFNKSSFIVIIIIIIVIIIISVTNLL